MYNSFRNGQLREVEQSLKIFQNYFQLARSPTVHFLSVRACVGSIPLARWRNGTPAVGDSALVNLTSGLAQRLACR